MSTRNIEKMASIDAQLRLLAPAKVSDDDKLVEYDALLLDRFLDILQDLHGEDIRETVLSFPLLVSCNANSCYFSFVVLHTDPAFLLNSTDSPNHTPFSFFLKL